MSRGQNWQVWTYLDLGYWTRDLFVKLSDQPYTIASMDIRVRNRDEGTGQKVVVATGSLQFPGLGEVVD